MVLEKDTCLWQKLPKAVHLRMTIDGLWPDRRPAGGGRHLVLILERKTPSSSLKTHRQRPERPMHGPMPHRWGNRRR